MNNRLCDTAYNQVHQYQFDDIFQRYPPPEVEEFRYSQVCLTTIDILVIFSPASGQVSNIIASGELYHKNKISSRFFLLL